MDKQKKRTTGRVTTSVNFYPEVLNAIKNRSTELDRSVSYVVNELLQDALKVKVKDKKPGRTYHKVAARFGVKQDVK